MWWLKLVGGLAFASVLSGLVVERALERRDRIAFPPPGRVVDIGGRRLHLLCKGDAPGPTVVVEQGAGSPSILWWPIQDQVKDIARICLYDRAGYQWSDAAPNHRTLDDRVEDLHNLLHTAGIPAPYVLVAHSFGGAVVRLFTRAYPAEVAGLVLIDTTPEIAVFRASYDAYAGKLVWFARAAGVAARLGIVRLAASFMRTPPAGLSDQGFRALKAFVSAPAFFRAAGDDPGALTRVPAVLREPGGFGVSLGDRPLIVLTHDVRFPGPAAVLEDGWREAQQALAAQSTLGVMEVAEGCNHMIPFEAPALVVDAIRRVVAKIRAGGAIRADMAGTK